MDSQGLEDFVLSVFGHLVLSMDWPILGERMPDIDFAYGPRHPITSTHIRPFARTALTKGMLPKPDEKMYNIILSII
jgi:hypothetical protein